MARPRREGLDYFPMDTDFFESDGALLAAGEDPLALGVYLRLLCRIYRGVPDGLGLDEAARRVVHQQDVRVRAGRADAGTAGRAARGAGRRGVRAGGAV